MHMRWRARPLEHQAWVAWSGDSRQIHATSGQRGPSFACFPGLRMHVAGRDVEPHGPQASRSVSTGSARMAARVGVQQAAMATSAKSTAAAEYEIGSTWATP